METVTVPTTGQTYQRPKIGGYPSVGWAAAFKDGASWTIVYVDADDFTAIDADAQCVEVFEGLLDASGARNPRDLRAWLAARTVGSIPAAARTRIQNRLTSRGVDLTGITLASTLEDLMLRAIRFHSAGALLDQLGIWR